MKRRRRLGWVVQMLGRGKWLGRYRAGGAYISKTHPTKEAAETWAQQHLAAQQLGLQWQDARLVKADELVRAFLASMGGRRLSLAHQLDTKRGLEALAKAVPNLAAPGAGLAIDRWLTGLTLADGKTPVSAASRNKRLVMVRALCRWAMDKDLLAKDPTRGIKRAPLPDYLRAQFSIDELRQALRQTHFKAPRGTEPKRDPYHALFAVMLYAGLRFDEAAMLRWQDIDLKARTIMVSLSSGARVKRQRERLVPVQAELATILEPLKKESGPVFMGRRWNPTRGFRAFLGRAGIAEDAGQGPRSPHSCRHTYAGLMTATGVPSLLLMAYMGHTSAATTMGYTKLAARYAEVVKGWGRGEFSLR